MKPRQGETGAAYRARLEAMPATGVLLAPGYVSIDRTQGSGFRWWCERGPRHHGLVHASRSHALRLLRRHEWEDHAQRPPLPTALNAWAPGAIMRPRRSRGAPVPGQVGLWPA